jgi:hypothetical protein
MLQLGMSALGHKRTLAVQNMMSALHPKADMCSATNDVRFGPKADTKYVTPSRHPSHTTRTGRTLARDFNALLSILNLLT